MKKRLVIGISGASGANLAIRLLQAMRDHDAWETHLVCSEASRRTIEHETTFSYAQVAACADCCHDIGDVGASIASGSFQTQGMVVIPCSMKTLAGIAHGYAANLLLRAADVTLKERRKLLLLARETPLHLGHLNNMVTAATLGAVIMPPVLTHYIKPETLADVELHIVGKVLSEFGLELPEYRRWQGMPQTVVKRECNNGREGPC
jgi:polyprenyl P-hydroxybenzoate/phenylacrylic acid decarboxylase-like protein